MDFSIELTKAYDFTGATQLSLVHTHTLILGMFMFLYYYHWRSYLNYQVTTYLTGSSMYIT